MALWGRALQAEGAASAKALRQKTARCVCGIARSLVECKGVNEGEGGRE